MSRAFNGGTSLDMITFGTGAISALVQGPITMAILAKASGVATNTSYMLQGVNSTTPVFSALFSNNAGAKLFMENDFGNGVGGISATDWLWYVGTKASGSALPRWHVKNLTTNAAWAHTNGSATVASGTGGITAVRVGSNNSLGTTFRGSIAVVAIWDTALVDLDVEAACTYAYADAVVTKSAKWAVALNQASTATSVNNDAAGGGNQTALSGTTVDPSDPPGFSYSLGASQTATAALSVTATLAAGATASHASDATLPVTTTLAASGTGTRPAAAPLAVTTTLAASASGSRPADAALAVTTTLAAAATRTALPAASLPITATLAAALGYTATAAASLAVTTTALAATATTASATLSITVTLAAAVTRTALPTVGLAIAVTLTAAATRTGPLAASFAVTTTLTAGTGGQQAAAAALAVLTSFAASTGSAGNITLRPFTGSTARPGTGTTARPFAGITPRP